MTDLTSTFSGSGPELLRTAAPLMGATHRWSLHRTLYAYVERWARETPDHLAVIDVDDSTITYEELLCRVQQRAGRLRHMDARGRFVMSQRSRSAECYVDILACTATGAIYIPVDPTWPRARLDHIASITDAVATFTDVDLSDGDARPPAGDPLRTTVVDGFNAPSYCLFTSGSTGAPKGAIVTQMGMMNHLHSKVDLLGLTTESVVAQTAPTTFDVAIWQFCAALLVGGVVRVVATDASQDPHELALLLQRENITHIEVVPTVLREFLRALGPEDALPTLEFMLVTGEELPLRVGQEWDRRFPGIPLINAYGPTECSDDVTHARITTEALADGSVPIGTPIPNTSLYILRFADSAWHRVPAGAQGELFIAGPSVGLGYVGDSAKTAGAFAEVDGYPFRLYRTGDLVRQRPDGQLVYEGRVDRQVKINGVRIEPSEIENRILHEASELAAVAVVKYQPLIRERSAIVIRETNESFVRQGDARLAAFYQTHSGEPVSPADLESHARSVLPAPLRPSRWFSIDVLPTTPNGKVDTKRLELLATERSGVTVPIVSAPLPSRLRDTGGSPEVSFITAACSVLGHPVDPDATFIDSGGDSLRAIQLASVLRSFGCTVRVGDLLSSATLGALASRYCDVWARKAGTDQPRAGTTPDPESSAEPMLPVTCAMTSAQRGIYFQWLLEPESAYYNYQVLLECPPTLDVDKARRALDQALRANPQLFAQFEVDPSGSFVQTFPVDPIQARSVRACEAESEAEARRRCRERVARPFDLECGSSLVVDEIRIKSGSTWFVLTMNEILIDGWGAMKFAEQMADFYLSADPEAEEAVVAERIRSVVEYFQNAVDDGPLTPEAQEFWAVSLDGVKPGSPLRDTDDPGYNPYAASITEISLDGASTQAIRSAAQALESSPFAIFVAAYALALATTSDQDDFVVGAPVAGRQHEGTDDLPTLMLNMVAIRVLLDRNQASLDAVRTLTTSTTNATAFSDSRFGAVVAEFAAHTNDDPLFSTMVNMLTYPTSEVWVGSGSLRLIELDTGFTKYDGSLYVQRHGEDYTLQIAHKLAHVTPERARTVLALTAWYLTSDWLSPTVSVAGLIASAQAALDVSRTATLPMPAPEDGGDCAPAA